MQTLHLPTLASLFGCLLAIACRSDSPNTPPATATAPLPTHPHQLVVFATQSLALPLQQLARHYESLAPGATVQLRLAGGDDLLAARNAGEACDVLCIGDSSQMSRFAAAAHLQPRTAAELARNRLAIATARGNPRSLRSLRDLANAADDPSQPLRVALGRSSSSIGRYSRWALSAQQLALVPALQLATADAVLAAVADGRVDAGIVYANSRDAAEQVELVPIAAEENQPVLYSIGIDRQAKEPAAALAFLQLALSPAGQGMLQAAGLLPIGAK